MPRYSVETIEAMQKLLVGYRDNLRVEVKSGIPIVAKEWSYERATDSLSLSRREGATVALGISRCPSMTQGSPGIFALCAGSGEAQGAPVSPAESARACPRFDTNEHRFAAQRERQVEKCSLYPPCIFKCWLAPPMKSFGVVAVKHTMSSGAERPLRGRQKASRRAVNLSKFRQTCFVGAMAWRLRPSVGREAPSARGRLVWQHAHARRALLGLGPTD